VVVKLDRLARSTRDVLNLVHELEAKSAALTVLEPAFSTKDPTGSILVTVLGMVAEMERRFIRERQQAGIEAAKKRVSIVAASPLCLPTAFVRCVPQDARLAPSRRSSGSPGCTSIG
jgi:DNA invertase Pin-like site-specific DNA recombinase